MNIFTRVLVYLGLAEEHTVSTIVADFHKVVDRLEGHAQATRQKAIDLSNAAMDLHDKADDLADLSDEHHDEADKALQIAANVAALVTPVTVA